MKKYFTLSHFVLLSVAASSQTNVSGFINANTTWNMAGSPYIVVANTLVSQGYKLTIDSGVVIKFDTSCALQVDGQLIAIGTAQNRITFTSNQAVPKAGDWAELHFADFSTNATFDANGKYLSGCILKYCDVLYSGSLGYGAVHIESSSPYISQCTVQHSAASGIYCNGASFLLDSSTVNDCANYGMYFSKIALNSCGLSVGNDTIENNKQGGLYLQDAPGCTTMVKNNYFYSNATNGAFYCPNNNNIYITNNYFISNTSINYSMGIVTIYGNNHYVEQNYFTGNSTTNQYSSILAISYTSSPSNSGMNQTIKSNYFNNNTTSGSNAGVVRVNGSKRLVSQNYFIGNHLLSSGSAILDTYGNTDTVTCNFFQNNQTSQFDYGCLNVISFSNTIISKNIFDGNYNNAMKGISVGNIYCYSATLPVYFINNTIKNNSAPGNICLQLSPSLTSNNQALRVDHNDFANNTANSVVFFTGPNTANATYNFLNMSWNNFVDPNSKYELYNNIPYGSPNMYPDSNYWGSSSSQHVDSVIYDYFDFANNAVVYYQPLLEIPNIIDTVCSSGIPTTIADQNAIGDNSKPYPNPFSSYTRIDFADELKDASLLLYNVFGQKVKEMTVINGRHITISRENLPGGIYIYEVMEKQKRISNGKLVVE